MLSGGKAARKQRAVSALAARDAVARSPLMTQAYATALSTRAAWDAARGRRLAALESLLRALRAVGPEGSSPARRGRLAALVAEFCGDGSGGLLPMAGNRLLSEFQRSSRARALRAESAGHALEHRVRLRFPREPEDQERQGDLIVLKSADPASGEKGVLLLNYTEAMERFAAVFDVAALASSYQLVLEPSWWGYEDIAFLRFLGSDLDVIVESPWRRDFEFIGGLKSNLLPVRVGAGDWTDPEVFRPREPGRAPTFDLVMVSNWNPLKRHGELFRTLGEIQRRHGRSLRVALIGYPAGWTRQDIERLAAEHGVAESCTLFEGIAPERVAEVVADARAYVLLSRREGANRALYEAIFCDTPIVVHRQHRGVNTDHVRPEVGVLFDDGGLADAILEVVDNPGRFAPRRWALEATGYRNATRQINEAARRRARERGLPWTRDIAAKKNIPNLRYACAGEYRDFEAEYRRLERYLLPVQ